MDDEEPAAVDGRSVYIGNVSWPNAYHSFRVERVR